mmetsp:Transcript_23817/g.66962  ORF Transcript_23817/g.66962 Transcript_23817/m.66962 type:complete len:342 (+) Transcript_23817:344-1369(+)
MGRPRRLEHARRRLRHNADGRLVVALVLFDDGVQHAHRGALVLGLVLDRRGVARRHPRLRVVKRLAELLAALRSQFELSSQFVLALLDVLLRVLDVLGRGDREADCGLLVFGFRVQHEVSVVVPRRRAVASRRALGRRVRCETPRLGRVGRHRRAPRRGRGPASRRCDLGLGRHRRRPGRRRRGAPRRIRGPPRKLRVHGRPVLGVTPGLGLLRLLGGLLARLGQSLVQLAFPRFLGGALPHQDAVARVEAVVSGRKRVLRRQRGVVQVLGLGDAGRGRRRLLRRLESSGQPALLFSEEFCFDTPSLRGLLLLPQEVRLGPTPLRGRRLAHAGLAPRLGLV